MGQAVIDLPDPSEVPHAPMTSADDLLSQLAGDEIDRLLAEAEVERGQTPLTSDPSADANDAELQAQSEAQIDDLMAHLQATPDSYLPPASTEGSEATGLESPADEARPSINPSPTTEQSSELESANGQELRSTLNDPVAAARELDEALARAGGATLSTPPPALIPAAIPAPVAEAETTAAEKSALTEAIEQIDPSASVLAEPAPGDAGAVPLILKPLVWLNSPMELLPPGMREILGKVAVLTLFNAIAVFAYVLLFRKHR